MRRWNGWGDDATIYPVPDSALEYLKNVLGPLSACPDATQAEVLAHVPASRLEGAHGPECVQVQPLERLLHARGQSLPDWVALHSGRVPVFPDGVAFPTSRQEVRALLDFAYRNNVRLIPYGGGTSVVGHINPLPSDTPVLTVDMSRMDALLNLDEPSHLATFGAGVMGPALEKQLNARGFTLGHFPQSFELSTLGGWIASRSTGQQSYYYGRIEALFAAAHLETPRGALDVPAFPASAAGPDLHHFVLGSEGRLGVITEATVRVRSLPEFEEFYGAFFHNWAEGASAVQEIVQAGVPVSMLRMSDAVETETTLILSGKERLVALAHRGLGLLRYGPERSMLIYGITGRRSAALAVRRQTDSILRAHGGLPTGTTIGHTWRKSRFLTPYLRNTLWEKGVVVDTLETALPWSKVLPAAEAIRTAIHAAAAEAGEKVLVFAHLSHNYNDGASFYVTMLFRRCADPDELVERWLKMKSAASQVIVAHGGTISHQHGVGVDHLPYMAAEKGKLGMEMIQSICRQLDPEGNMNPGKLFG